MRSEDYPAAQRCLCECARCIGRVYPLFCCFCASRRHPFSPFLLHKAISCCCSIFQEEERGTSFDWSVFALPLSLWILAGGLRPDNVGTAIDVLQPGMVDVASGVEYSQSTRKNPALIEAFIQRAKSKQRVVFGGQFLPEILMTPIESRARME